MSRTTVIQDLRRTVDCLPLHTRVAMLEGLAHERIIVGAYTDGTGGVCPMLAAHRRGGRTSFLQFAKTWDRFTRAPSRGSRPATRREVSILRRHLEASIDAASDPLVDFPLAQAIAEHEALVARAPVARDVPAASGRGRTGRRRIPGPVRLPSWMRPIASVEEYERVLELVDRQQVRLGLAGDTDGPGATREVGGDPVRADDPGINRPPLRRPAAR